MKRWVRFVCVPMGALGMACAGAVTETDDEGLLFAENNNKPGETLAAEGFVKEDQVEEAAEPETEPVAQVEGAAVDNTYAVGVMPIDGVTCPADSSRVTFYMDDEDDASQTDSALWDLPQTPRKAIRAPFVAGTRYNTSFQFCKVNGQKFKPMTTDVNEKSKFYAVLKLGQYCPNGSWDMSRYIDNEDDSNANSRSGPISPNSSNTNTTFKYCYFHTGVDGALMSSFPGLGINYAVFHDYDGSQPSFVLAKRWLYSDDEDDANQNRSSPTGTTQAVDFARIVGTGANTMFDMAQVR